jgi:antitoxin HicB
LALTKKLPAVFYCTKPGGRPVREFLIELPREDRRIIGEHIATVEYGWPTGKPTCAPIGLGLWEVHEGGKEMTKTRKGKNPHIGESFDSFLKEEGIYESVKTTAIKRVLAMQLEDAMKQQNLTKVEMARRMRTSRVQLDRLLDPDNDSVTLATLRRAAAIVGREVRLELV